MPTRIPTLSALLVVTFVVAACGSGADDSATSTATNAAVSGRIEDGLRVLTLDPAAPGDFTIYRGDYVRLETPGDAPVTIVIPDLGVEKTYPVAEGDKPYFKVPDTGSFAYTAGDGGGTITAREYAASGYQEVSAQEAATMIHNIAPFILDVRTEGEFATGHLQGATLVPVQVLQQQVGTLAAAKDQPVFVYCRSGNRSTVAARILMNAGYEQVINLRHGIREWQQQELPLVR
jgi:rhodanese-related sulfurtransferase